MTKKIKAYTVREDYEGHCVIAFATNNATARREGGREMDLEFDEVESCRRAPEFDQYAPGPVPPTALLEHGWWFECLHCGTKISLDDEREDDDGNPIEFSPIDHGDQVFCNAACQAMHFSERRANAAAKVALQELVETKYPLAKVTEVHVYGQKLEASEPGRGVNASAHFILPGLKYPVTYHFGDDSRLYVTNFDMAVFKERYGAKGRDDVQGASGG